MTRTEAKKLAKEIIEWAKLMREDIRDKDWENLLNDCDNIDGICAQIREFAEEKYDNLQH